ncbi:MAG: BamA/TamA family outer membrane protein [Leeuwenhoekiella sp.]
MKTKKTPYFNQKSSFIRCFLLVFIPIFGFMQSCSVEKFIPEDKLLYEGANLEVTSDTTIANQSGLEEQLKGVLRPQPNGKFLGMRPGLYFHYKAQREKPGFINKFLNKKMGEEPVYLSDVQTLEMEKLLLNRLENNGFFYSNATSATAENEEDKTGSVTYNVKVANPYDISSYQLNSDSLLVYREIQKGLDNAILKKGMRFNLNAFKAERSRIDNQLKNEGYYNFNPGFLIFEADTNRYDTRKLDMYVKLKNDVPEKSVIPYKISSLNIYPDYGGVKDSTYSSANRIAEKNFYQKDLFFKPKRLDPFILIEEGQYYDPEISKNTSRRLGSIGIYKFINIQYKEQDSLATDSLGQLQADIYLAPLNKYALRAELQGVTKSNGFAGPTLQGTFTNRNIFNGGEILNLTAKVGYEIQTGGGANATAGKSTLLLGLNADLIFPRLLFPIKIDKNWFEYSIPKTKISLGVDYLNRTGLYTLLSGTSTFGYLWQANRYVNHELNPIAINYVNLINNTPEFQDILDANLFLANSFEQQFISGLTYSFTYNGMVDTEKTHQFFANINFDTAGNSISLITGSDQEEPKKFIGNEFAQYAKIDGDFRYHFNFGKEQKIATRIFAGIGVPYGNSSVLPYTKQYFSGGPYSVRAFQIRSLGPGTYEPVQEGSTSSFFDQIGNLRLEANIEYRFPIFGIVKGAFFGDAGNVWNTSSDGLEGGKFTSDWFNQLGIGVGTGVRIDIQNFVIRFDLAAPVHDPKLPEGERWDFNLAEPVFNFAIGYPF